VALTGARAERTVFLTGDVDEPAVRRALLADRAAGVVLTTQRDLVNLEAAFELADAHPHLRVAALVADAALHRGAAPVSGQGGPILFNAHRIAAEHLYRTALHAHFRHTHGGDAVVIAGFGRFGQAFLEFLQDEAGGELASVVLVDLHAAQHAGAFADRVGFTPPCKPIALDGDVADPRTWDAVEAALQRAGHPPVRLLCTERDDVNLQAAMLLRARGVTDRLFARVEHDTAFVRRLAAHHGFELLAVDATLTLALRERHRAWFLDGGP
jgi:hypothetical protein